MANGFVQGLYDMSAYQDDNGMTKIDEQKLRRALDGNKKLFANNKDIFKEEPKSETCSMYNPCPICSKCGNKASHLYVRCQTCRIPICVHKYSDKKFMIRRENFLIKANGELKEAILGLLEEYNGGLLNEQNNQTINGDIVSQE